jgi:hypothetical protein
VAAKEKAPPNEVTAVKADIRNGVSFIAMKNINAVFNKRTALLSPPKTSTSFPVASSALPIKFTTCPSLRGESIETEHAA